MKHTIVLTVMTLLGNHVFAQDQSDCGNHCSSVDRYAFTQVIHGRDNPNRIELAEAMITFLSGTFLRDELLDGTTPPDVRVTRFFDVDIGEAAAFLTILHQEIAGYRTEAAAIKAELCARSFPNGQAYADAANENENRVRAARGATYSQLKSRIPSSVLAEMEAIEDQVLRRTTIVVIDFDEVVKHYDFRELVASDCGGN